MSLQTTLIMVKPNRHPSHQALPFLLALDSHGLRGSALQVTN
jgi:hypothetical protein